MTVFEPYSAGRVASTGYVARATDGDVVHDCVTRPIDEDGDDRRSCLPSIDLRSWSAEEARTGDPAAGVRRRVVRSETG